MPAHPICLCQRSGPAHARAGGLVAQGSGPGFRLVEAGGSVHGLLRAASTGTEVSGRRPAPAGNGRLIRHGSPFDTGKAGSGTNEETEHGRFHSAHRRKDSRRSAGDPRCRSCHRGAGRELSCRAGCPRRQPNPLRDLPDGGRRGQHGGGPWRVDRPAGHLFRDAGAGCASRERRRSHRRAGQFTDDPLRGAGRPRHAGPGGVPGDRLRRGLRVGREMGRRGR